MIFRFVAIRVTRGKDAERTWTPIRAFDKQEARELLPPGSHLYELKPGSPSETTDVAPRGHQGTFRFVGIHVEQSEKTWTPIPALTEAEARRLLAPGSQLYELQPGGAD